MGTFIARGGDGVEALRQEAASSGRAAHWPSAVLLDIA